MFGLPLAFVAPAVLAGLITLPVIWWLLRATPPRPNDEVFPPLRILAKAMKREETPQKSPWWLTALRLLIAGLIIIALSGPLWNPRPPVMTGEGLFAMAIDNGWASATDWAERVETAEVLIDQAAENGQPIYLAFTAEPANAQIGPFDATAARQRLAAVSPRPIAPDRQTAFQRLQSALDETESPADIAFLSDGVATEDDQAAFAALEQANAGNLILAAPARLPAIATTDARNEADALVVTLHRPAAGSAEPFALGAFDSRGRRIADAQALFGANETESEARFEIPFDLRNDIVRLAVDGANHAGAVRLLDDDARRRRVGLIGGTDGVYGSQPLLEPLFYIRRALAPFADMVEPTSDNLDEAVQAVLDQKPAMIVLADVGVLPETVERALLRWVDGGGMLIRFAGPRLAGTDTSGDPLLPVTLRSGERSLGGALSFTEPQPVADFPPESPFAALIPPRDVKVQRQVLAEPTPELADHAWATLEDGTPLVTARGQGDGRLILFHVTSEASWSNLPLSGSFVDMLRELTRLSRNQGALDADAEAATSAAALPPLRVLDANGLVVQPGSDVRPIDAETEDVSLEHPPGLYGTNEATYALNLMKPDDRIEPISFPAFGQAQHRIFYESDTEIDLRGPLLAIALLLLALDTLINLWISGALSSSRRWRAGAGRATAASILALGIGLALIQPNPALAQDEPASGSASPQSEETSANDAIEALTRTRLGYILTGDAETDRISRAGLRGLSAWLIGRTAMEPGEPAAIDVERDELSFYPILYWPVVPGSPDPSADAMAKIDAYMRNGGTVLFDTKDEFSQDLRRSGQVTSATRKLREILATLNVPPLEPVPSDHVLGKSFYILPSFPGRYAGSPLWVEAAGGAQADPARPVRRADGVSPILITGNDLAGAWAISDDGRSLLPVVPGGERQREYAYRVGTNIVMYMLTGNYKADQVHVPALLERLGQ